MSYDLLKECLEIHSVNEISKILNIVPGTVNRWLLLEDVPTNYDFDLLKILGKEIDYSQYSSKSKDQFFTPPDMAKNCIDIFVNETGIDINQYTFIEPSAGDGSFYKLLPTNKIGLDIEPRCEGVLKEDFLLWKPENNIKYIVIGNPPFGLRGHLALNFINHSFEFADYVAFILPQLFESDGRGSPRKRVNGFNLIYSEKLSGMFHVPDGDKTRVNGVFQIWSKHTKNNKYELVSNNNKNIKIFSISDGGTVSSRRNVNMIGKCHLYIPSTCFGEANMKTYDDFESLPGRKGYGIYFETNVEEMIEKTKNISWKDVSFKSTNSALNLRTSIISKNIS